MASVMIAVSFARQLKWKTQTIINNQKNDISQTQQPLKVGDIVAFYDDSPSTSTSNFDQNAILKDFKRGNFHE